MEVGAQVTGERRPNPYLELIARKEGVQEARRDYDRKLKELKRRKIEPLQIAQKFERANMKHEYLSVYNLASSFAHNDISALIQRHVSVGPMIST